MVTAPVAQRAVIADDKQEVSMSEFTVRRLLDAPRERVWHALTRPDDFEGWLPAKSGKIGRAHV